MADRASYIVAKFETFVKATGNWFSIVAGGILVGMMAFIFADVLMRYFFNNPIEGSYEITEQILMVSIVFFALAFASHIRVTFAVERLPRKVNIAIRSITLLLAVSFFIVLAWQSWNAAVFSMRMGEFAEGIYHFALYPSRFVVFIGFALLVLKLLVSLISNLLGRGEISLE